MTTSTRAEDSIETLGRRCWAALETVHVIGYFAPEPAAAYRELGLKGRAAYFAARSAPMGPVPAQVTVATFYVFAPALVERAIPAAWDIASPTEVLAARHSGIVATLHRVLGDPDVDEALELAKTACAALSVPGRALYAGHASLPWPDDPLLGLWHAASLLREHRGDGHVAALLLSGLDPVEAAITGGLASNTTEFARSTRGWTDGEWPAGEARLRERGLIDSAGLTEAGTALRSQLEEQTDRAAEVGWRHLGAEGAARLLELVRPLRRSLLASGIFPASLTQRS
jgi:hypothetical protein